MTSKQYLVTLTEAQHAAWLALAEVTGSVSASGPKANQPSLSVLMQRIIDSETAVTAITSDLDTVNAPPPPNIFRRPDPDAPEGEVYIVGNEETPHRSWAYRLAHDRDGYGRMQPKTD